MNKEAQLALEGLLAGLDRDQLQSLLLKLVEQEPSLITTIEKQVAVGRASTQPTIASPMTPPKPSIAVDTKAVRRQVRSSIHGLDPYALFRGVLVCRCSGW